jgi:hypothetical protein
MAISRQQSYDRGITSHKSTLSQRDEPASRVLLLGTGRMRGGRIGGVQRGLALALTER